MNKIFSKMGFVLLSFMLLAMLGISYGAYTGALYINTSLSSGSMDMKFSEKDDQFSLEIQIGKNDKPIELRANKSYDGKTLKISEMDPIDMSLLENGDLRFIIRYGIKPSDSSSILKASMKKPRRNKEQEYVTFERTTASPQIIIKDNSEELDSKITAGVASQIIYDYLPDNLGDFYVTKNLLIDEKENIMQGVIILEQKEALSWPFENHIKLSNLDIQADELALLEKQDNLTLLLKGCYGFEIPLVLDQFNTEQVN